MLKLQQECFENIKSLCSNYKKDGAQKKTEEYLCKRLESLNAQWQDFEERHAKLLREIEDKSINYFTDNVYENTKQLVQNTIQHMEGLLRQLRERKQVAFDLSGMLDEVTDNDVKVLLSKQECNFKALDRAMSKVDCATITEKWEMEDHLSILKTKWDVIDKLHWELEAVLQGSNIQYYNTFVALEGKYDELRRKLNTKIWSTIHYEKTAPKIEIPEFSGNYTQWISFKDLFLETIHNNPRINNAQKMQHLKTRLRGEAERLVQHLNISAENYQSCWEILTQRYDNRRLQFTSFVNTILNLSVIQHPDSFNLKKMHDVITECLNGLANIGIDTSTWDPLIVHLMSQKLDSTSYTDYMKELHDHRELPRLNEFLFFLESKFMAYESMKNAKKEITNTLKQASTKQLYRNFPMKKNSFEPKKYTTKAYHTTFGHCPHCEGNHVLMQCPTFIDMDTIQRNRLPPWRSDGGKLNTKSKPSTSSALSSNHLANNEVEILLTTVQLQLKTANGNFVTLRALLDQGSQVNLITESAAQLLRLPRTRLNATISGVGAVSGDCKGRIQLTCKSIHSDFTFQTQALVMSKLTKNLPNTSFEKTWPHLENLKLADPQFNVSRPVDLLLGAEVYSDIILDGVLKGGPKAPIAQQTHLGWILCGKLQTFSCHVTLVNFDDITKFLENEDIIQDSHDISQDDQCEEYYVKTVHRASDGRYTVTMPLVANCEQNMGNSRSIAISQFLQLEKRLERNNKLAVMYRNFMKEYADLQHMKPAARPATQSLEYYLPHHGVLREHAATTKLRVVFNASQKTTSGYSLNQLQEKGPNLQKDIQALILKWRSYQYAYTADIEKCYRCIQLAEEQQSLQKIIWRNSPTERLQEYQLCTVTYGMKCAPWLAMRTLKQLAIDDRRKFPEASDILQNEMYVDDLVTGHNSIHAAKNLQSSLIKLLKGGGMNLRKWSANHPALLEDLSAEQKSNASSFDFKHEESMKTLGLGWNPSTDTFVFKWDLENNTKLLTKRSLLSQISKLYDPLGWLSPITVAVKLLFQKVWLSKVAWDETLSDDIQEDWKKLSVELPEVKNITLNRWLGGTQQNIHLLGFCDASEKAYSCVVYSRIVNKHGATIITLLAAKTRVAPLAQKTTLPRLELCGALLLSQLIEKIKAAYKGYEITTQAWCDSQVVLAWLQGDVARWEKYVANRVTKIKQTIPAENWSYVKSEQNPADCASRGLYPIKLRNFNLWWQGPEFLKTTHTQDVSNNKSCYFTTEAEMKTQDVTTLATNRNEHFINKLLNKCSSLQRVIRVIAWALRFATNTRISKKINTAYLTISELSGSITKIIICVQQTELPLEYKQLTKKESISHKSSIYKLNPFLDDLGIVRVGGRLNNSNLPSRMKNPVILSKGGRFTQLLIDQAHSMTLHGGARLTLAYLRQRYWIVGGNRAVKERLRHCIRCHRYKPAENYQLMGDLPYQRTTPSRPFTHTGVDFTGHVQVKINKGRGVKTSKGYVAIFVCMATKAVHIELVSDLSTENFIAAFQRMCARRGTPKHVYSDCGTNFIGASKMLRNEFEDFKQALSPEFFTEIGKLEVQWHFNAPAWPSVGGLWEAAVKSMKYHLHRVLGEQKLTYEEFATLLTKIEACMNSRPLCPLTEDPEEFYNCLTPGHFLTGGLIMSLPLSDYSDDKTIDVRSRWQLTENMLQQFWKTWSNEYLTQLQGRSKWNKTSRNIQEGDIVLVKENNLPPGKWAFGRVLDVHPGSDGLVRVTTIKTQAGITKRPVVKLSPLPLHLESETGKETGIDANKPDSDNSAHPTIKEKGLKKIGYSTLFTTLITMFILISGARATNSESARVHITSLEPDRPIYYDTLGEIRIIHDEWNLIMFYNLSNYWDNVQQIENYLMNLTEMCNKVDIRYCKPTLAQLSHEMDMVHHYNSILLAPHKQLSVRKKRGLINGIGYVANELFGILDQNFAEKYQSDISAIQDNEGYLLELIKNQTSIVQLENQVLKKTEDNINQQVEMINEFMNESYSNFAKVESAMEIMMATSYFSSASLATFLLLNNLKSMQEMLYNTLTNVYKGHVDVHLLTPVILLEQLDDISGKLLKSIHLPVDNVGENFKDMYKILYMKARVTTNYFLFEVHIPLTSDDDFLLYRAYPLPVRTNTTTTTIQIQSQHVAVNFQKNAYISLAENAINLCTQLKRGIYICGKNTPIFNLNHVHAPCEAKLLSHRSWTPCDVTETSCDEAWFPLSALNSWLSVCCGTCTFRTICNKDVTSYNMTSSGIVTLAQGCMLQSHVLTIYSHNEYNTNIKMNYKLDLPILNSTVNKIVKLGHNNVPWTEMPNEDIEEIDRRLLLQRNHEALPKTIVTHDLHLYIVCYTLLALAVITPIVWLLRKRYIFCNGRQNHTEDRIYEDIELRPKRPSRERSAQMTSVQAHPLRPAATTAAADNVAFDFN